MKSVEPAATTLQTELFARGPHRRPTLSSDGRWTRFGERKPPTCPNCPPIHQPPRPSGRITDTSAPLGANRGEGRTTLPVCGERATSGPAATAPRCPTDVRDTEVATTP